MKLTKVLLECVHSYIDIFIISLINLKVGKYFIDESLLDLSPQTES